jgi:hypothetical protein
MVIHFNHGDRPQARVITRRVLSDIRIVLDRQALTSTWTEAYRGQALVLLNELSQDWEIEGVRVDALQELGQLTDHLDMVAATVTRANLEALREQVRLALNAATLMLERTGGL